MPKELKLPHSEKYTLIGILYSGGLTEHADICHNCGQVITNIATVKNTKGEQFTVGLDCASTLTGINNTDAFSDAKANMRDAINLTKAIREMKDNNTLKVEKLDEHSVYVIGQITKKKRGKDELIWFRRNIWSGALRNALPDSIKALLNINNA